MFIILVYDKYSKKETIMKLKDLLLEMPIKIDTIQTKFGYVDIQIRTKSLIGGQSEHLPPHIHVIWKHNGTIIDTPVLISTPPDYYTNKCIKFYPVKLENIVFNYIIHNYNHLKITFDRAQQAQDPSTTYRASQQGTLT